MRDTLRQVITKQSAAKQAKHFALGKETANMLIDLCEHVS